MTAIRVFDGKANPHEPFWYFGNTLEGSEEPVMELYGYISEFSWFEDDITPRLFKDDLWRYGNGGPITIMCGPWRSISIKAGCSERSSNPITAFRRRTSGTFT